LLRCQKQHPEKSTGLFKSHATGQPATRSMWLSRWFVTAADLCHRFADCDMMFFDLPCSAQRSRQQYDQSVSSLSKLAFNSTADTSFCNVQDKLAQGSQTYSVTFAIN